MVSPDVAFVRHDRLPPTEERTRFLRVVPDLAVEIRSPTDVEADVRAKVAMYLAAGVRLVWLVDTRTQTVEEVRPDSAGPPVRERDLELTALFQPFRLAGNEV